METIAKNQGKLQYHKYLMESDPRYETVFTHYCSTVQAAQHPCASLEQLNNARRAVACRADWLMGRQRRSYSKARADAIVGLHSVYDLILGRMVGMGWTWYRQWGKGTRGASCS